MTGRNQGSRPARFGVVLVQGPLVRLPNGAANEVGDPTVNYQCKRTTGPWGEWGTMGLFSRIAWSVVYFSGFFCGGRLGESVPWGGVVFSRVLLFRVGGAVIVWSFGFAFGVFGTLSV